MTREQWLIDASNALRPLFQLAGAPLPTELPQLSISLPSRGALSGKTVGQCFWQAAPMHVFISPLHKTPFEVIDTLAHELVHVVTPGAKHGGKFVKVCKALGLTSGKPTSAAAGPELTPKLEKIITELGALPHVALDPKITERKPQTTRMLKAWCEECQYTVRVSAKWLDVARPTCPNEDCGSHTLHMAFTRKEKA